MSGYIVLAENITYKNNKLSCINIYDNISPIVLPSEFIFDIAILCGPDWKTGEHKLKIKAEADNNKEIELGDFTVTIPDENFVYNAYANNIKLPVDDSIKYINFKILEDDKVVISRKYMISAMFIRQKVEAQATPEPKQPEKKKKKKDK